MYKNCKGCGREFELKNKQKSKKFCNVKCYGKLISKNRIGKKHPNFKEKIRKTCLSCSKFFLVSFSRSKDKTRGKFCSKECFDFWRSENLKGEKAPNWKGGKEKINCIGCNKIFFISLKQIKRGRGKFCSVDCYGNYRSKNLKGEQSPNWKGGRKTVICLVCDSKFTVDKSKLKLSKFCSTSCFHRWHSQNIAGVNHWNWAGGLTSIKERIRKNKKYKHWRLEIFTRDNYICRVCGQVGGDLEVHHKLSLSELLDDIKITLPLLDLYEAALIYYPLWDINNGVTLCKKCHKKTNSYLKK